MRWLSAFRIIERIVRAEVVCGTDRKGGRKQSYMTRRAVKISKREQEKERVGPEIVEEAT
jgi:hypothetical protein